MRKDDIVTGLFLGDEGKGTAVDYLAHLNRPVSVVRTGGPQAAHNVVSPDGTHHTFAQFGSASLQEVPTILSKYMLVNPFNLVTEGDLLYAKTGGWNPFSDLLISENSLLITPLHIFLNKKREDARGSTAHGSTGEGIGETRLFHIRHPEYAPIMGDLQLGNLDRLKTKLQALYEYVEEECSNIWDEGTVDSLHQEYINLATDEFLNIVDDEKISERIREGYTIFECSQGVLLDESLGFHPHTTWTGSTSQNAQQLLSDANKPAATVIGVTRTYATRHGNGPLPSELPNTDENITRMPEDHNAYGHYQGGWRRGHLDLPLLEYAVRANKKVDLLFLTHCDLVTKEFQVVTSYRDWKDIPSTFYDRDRVKQEEITSHLMSLSLEDAELTQVESLEELEELLEQKLEVPVGYRSFGKTYDDKTVVQVGFQPS